MGIKNWVIEWLFEDIYRRIDELERKEVKDVGELNDALIAIKDQLTKAKDEILAKIATLEGQIGSIPADAQATLEELKGLAQVMDDINPDQPA